MNRNSKGQFIKIKLNKKKLEILYIDKLKSAKEIAKDLKSSISSVLRYLSNYNIPIRNTSQARLLFFSKNPKYKIDSWFRIGKLHQSFKHGKYSKITKNYCKCGKLISPVANRCRSCACSLRIKERSPNYRGGKSLEPYPFNWTKKYRFKIRYRDNFICQLCDKTEEENKRKLHVHHIDYDKENINPDNLISLCTSCHMKTNYNRNQWQDIFELFSYKEIFALL